MRLPAVILVVCAVLAIPVGSLAQNCDGLTVATVVYDGCERGACSDSGLQERLTRLTELLGQEYSQARADVAQARLEKSGYFQTVSGSCRKVSPSDATVVFKVLPHRYIRKTTITGTKVIFATDLEKRVFLNTGSVFNPDDKKSKDRLERQLATLTSFVRQEGFDTATVEVKVDEVEPDLVDITITVNEGKISRVGRVTVDVEGPWDRDDPPGFSCPVINQRDVVRASEAQRGDLFTSSIARSVKKRVRKYLQQYGFQAPRVKVEFSPETQELSIGVKVDKCFSILVYEREEPQPYHQGFELTDDPELYQTLPFRESGVFDRREAQFGMQELLAYYRNRGFLFADVELQFVDYRDMVQGWPYPLAGGVIYRVSKGQPSEIREIRFTGVNAFEDDKLKALMDTRRYDFFDVGGYLQVQRLFADLDLVKNHYYRQGYFRMKYDRAHGIDETVRVQLIRKEDLTIYRYHFMDKSFDVIKPDWENAIQIDIAVNEGPGSETREVRLSGVKSFDPVMLYKGLATRAGGPFSAQLTRAAKLQLEAAYAKVGRSVHVAVRCSGSDPEVLVEACNVKELRSQRVDLEFVVTEGARHLMGEVLVVGNLKTRRKTIVREFPKQGEPFDAKRIDDAARHLRNLGVFSSIRIENIGLDEEPPRERVAVVVHVEEAHTKYAEISAGFQKMAERGEQSSSDETLMADGLSDTLTTSLSTTGAPLSGAASMQTIYFPDVLLLVDLAYTDRNFGGFGKDLVLPIKYGFSTRDPLRYAAFTPTYTDRRFLATDLTLRLTPLIVYDLALRYMDEFEYGLEAELSYNMLKFMYVGLKSKISRIAWKRPEDSDFEPQELQISVTPQIRFDWRDSPINPTSGISVGAKLTYLNALVDTEVDGVVGSKTRDNFLKYEVNGQLYLSFRKIVILATNLRFGNSLSLGDEVTHLPPTHKFYLGGTSGVRGFPARGVLQYDANGFPRHEQRPISGSDLNEHVVKEGGDTVLNGNVELRFPIVRASGIWAAVFLDTGALSDGVASLSGSSFRFSIGLGIRWLIGNQIPVRLDYGFILDPRCNAVSPTDGVTCISEDDVGALDFGLLYTF